MHYLRTLTYLWSLLTLLLMVAITTICSCVSTPQRSGQLKEQDEYDVAAYIWPSCHNDPMGRDTLWSEGTGEWEIIKKGNPRFEGHYQPKVPLWGYEMDDDTQVMEKWIDVGNRSRHQYVYLRLVLVQRTAFFRKHRKQWISESQE